MFFFHSLYQSFYVCFFPFYLLWNISLVHIHSHIRKCNFILLNSLHLVEKRESIHAFKCFFLCVTSDCTTEISKIYGEDLEYKLPQDFEILEFTRFHQLQEPLILWNGTYSFGGKVQVRKQDVRLPLLTQADNGFYNFMKKDKTLVTRLRLSVEGDDGSLNEWF